MRKKDQEDDAAKLDNHQAATAAATAAAATTGRKSQLPESRQQEGKKLLERAAQERSKETGESFEKAKKAIEDETKRMEYAIEFFEADGGVFYKPTLGNGL